MVLTCVSLGFVLVFSFVWFCSSDFQKLRFSGISEDAKAAPRLRAASSFGLHLHTGHVSSFSGSFGSFLDREERGKKVRRGGSQVKSVYCSVLFIVFEQEGGGRSDFWVLGQLS